MDMSRFFWEDDHSEPNASPNCDIPLPSQSGEYVEPESGIKESVSDNYFNSSLPQDSDDASSHGDPESNKGQSSPNYSEKRKRTIKSVETQVKKSKYSLQVSYPVMFSNIIQSNFLYHTTSKINIPHNLPKIPGLPVFNSMSNVNILPKSADFISAFS